LESVCEGVCVIFTFPRPSTMFCLLNATARSQKPEETVCEGEGECECEGERVCVRVRVGECV